MRKDWLDILLTLWIVLVAAAFFIPLLLCKATAELELVARCVYLCVVAAGLVGLAVRVFRTDQH